LTIPGIFITLFWIPIGIYFLTSFFSFLGLRRRRHGRNTELHTTTVVVAARNEEEDLPDLLESLLFQDYPDEKYEIIVVDDQSEDATPAVIEDYARRSPQIHSIRITETPEEYSPKKYALSRGVREADGDIILTVDADCVVKPTWIRTMNSYFEENVGMVVGYSGVAVSDESTFLERWQSLDFLTLMAANEAAMNWGLPLSASGQNLGFSKQAFEEVGGYRPISDRATGDDVLLLQLIRNRTDFDILFAGNSKAYNSTKPESTIQSLFQQRVRWASDAPIQLTMAPLFFIYLLIVFIMYLAVLGGLVLTIFTPLFLFHLIPGILVKLLGEFVLLRYATRLYERPGLSPLIPAWSLLQIPYVIITGLGGIFFDYTWKGRSRSEAEPFRKRLRK